MFQVHLEYSMVHQKFNIIQTLQNQSKNAVKHSAIRNKYGKNWQELTKNGKEVQMTTQFSNNLIL